MRLILYVVAAATLASVATGAGIRRLQKKEGKKKTGTTTYIVSLGKAARGEEAATCKGLADEVGGSVYYVYDKTLSGCALSIAQGTVTALASSPSVATLEEDQEVKALRVSSWGLDRIDQEDLPLDGSATKMNANGVKIYILDTGIKGNHNDFSEMIGPASCHRDIVENNALNDGHGHGTHVASTTCGITYGVAEGCTLCAVKVLGSNGSGTMAGVIAGIEHAYDDCGADEPCVINMSLGGGASTALDNAVATAVNDGVVVVVAAGNSNANACTASPARAELAITVGSTTSSDAPSHFSNWGTCVDVYAPGSAITAAWIGRKSATRTISGTSMASPHVAGIAAGHLGSGAASTPADVTSLILANVVEPGVDGRRPPRTQGLATIFADSQPGPTPPPTPSPTPPPTPLPTPPPTPSPTSTSCIECSDEPTPWMREEGYTCASRPHQIAKKCNESLWWVDNNYCQESCHLAGRGYVDCCGKCTECTDIGTPWMIEAGKECHPEYPGAQKKCNGSWWVEHHYCQQSCFDAGRGYDGIECC